jgi:hypothetical protein
MAHQSRLFGKSIVLTHEVDWEAVYQAELPRLYNFFRYRVGDNPGMEVQLSAFDIYWLDGEVFHAQ